MSARIISTVGRAIDVIVAGRLVSHLRFAAGVCVLAAGLLMGSAAVAVADPGSSNSAAHGDDGTNASSQDSPTASSPVGKVADTPRKKKQGVTSTLGSGRQPGQQPSTGAKSPKKEPGGTEDSGLAAAVPDLVAAVPTWSRRFPMWSRRFPIVVAPVPDVVAPVPDVVAPVRIWSRRFLIWSRRFLTSSRWFRTCSPRLPVRSSRSRNCRPTFPPSCWASPGCSQ